MVLLSVVGGSVWCDLVFVCAFLDLRVRVMLSVVGGSAQCNLEGSAWFACARNRALREKFVVFGQATEECFLHARRRLGLGPIPGGQTLKRARLLPYRQHFILCLQFRFVLCVIKRFVLQLLVFENVAG
jgi:hypothetical protein